MSSQQPPAEEDTRDSETDSNRMYQGGARRIVAIVIDSFLGFLTFLIVGFLIGSVTGETTATGFQLDGLSAFLAMGLIGLIGFAYYVVLEAYYGQTIGKWLTGIRVVTEDETQISLSDAVVRNFARIVDGFGFYFVGALVMWISDERQRLGDHAAGTVVVPA